MIKDGDTSVITVNRECHGLTYYLPLCCPSGTVKGWMERMIYPHEIPMCCPSGTAKG